MKLRRNADAKPDDGALHLDGDELELLSVSIDGRALTADEYEASPERLSIHRVPESFELQTRVRIAPEQNTKLMGLYTSNGAFCTQCEAEGFRRITYAFDRPDVMSRYTTRIEADRDEVPSPALQRKSRGTGRARGRTSFRSSGRIRTASRATSSRFVAGQPRLPTRESFTTASGREVALEIWVEPANADKCEHALASLKAAMKLGRGHIRPRVRPRHLHDRRGRRLQHGRDGEQGTQRLQLEVRAGQAVDRDRRRLRRHRKRRGPRVLPQLDWAIA